MGEEPGQTRWSQIGGVTGEEYAERFSALASSGRDMHGEASFYAALLAPASLGRAARVLDAGCGTGRVAVRLDELGFECVGADADESMLSVARRRAPHIPWHVADLSHVRPSDLGGASGFDLVVLAGNVVPLLAEGTLESAVRSLASLLTPRGRLVAGFGLDAAHLPPHCPVTPLAEYDAACTAAGLSLRQRHPTWDGVDDGPSEEYAVSVHVRGPGAGAH